jgi:hypothetical protein
MTNDEGRLQSAPATSQATASNSTAVTGGTPLDNRHALNAEQWLTAAEEAHIRRLVYDAFDLRDGPYLSDAVDAILDWRERTYLDRLERGAERAAS